MNLIKKVLLPSFPLAPLNSFLKRTRGSIAIEFALVLPLFILILSSSFEITMYALLQNKLQRLTSVMGDTIARKNITREALQAYIAQSAQFTTPFGFGPGKITVSQIQNINQSQSEEDMRISWQESFQGSATKLGEPGDTPINLPSGFSIVDKETAIVTEVKYQFDNFVFASVLGNRSIYVFYITTPRGGTMNVLLGEASVL